MGSAVLGAAPALLRRRAGTSCGPPSSAASGQHLRCELGDAELRSSSPVCMFASSSRRAFTFARTLGVGQRSRRVVLVRRCAGQRRASPALRRTAAGRRAGFRPLDAAWVPRRRAAVGVRLPRHRHRRRRRLPLSVSDYLPGAGAASRSTSSAPTASARGWVIFRRQFASTARSRGGASRCSRWAHSVHAYSTPVCSSSSIAVSSSPGGGAFMQSAYRGGGRDSSAHAREVAA